MHILLVLLVPGFFVVFFFAPLSFFPFSFSTLLSLCPASLPLPSSLHETREREETCKGRIKREGEREGGRKERKGKERLQTDCKGNNSPAEGTLRFSTSIREEEGESGQEQRVLLRRAGASSARFSRGDRSSAGLLSAPLRGRKKARAADQRRAGATQARPTLDLSFLLRSMSSFLRPGSGSGLRGLCRSGGQPLCLH